MSNFDHFIGTRAVSEQHAFDTAALSAWLQQHLEGFVGPLSVEMFKGGQSNPTYKLVTPGKSYVMRAKPGPVAKLLPSAHAIEREFAVMSGLQGTDVPVPRMHVLCEDESIIGRAFYIMEFMQGRVLWDQALPGMTPEERTAIYNESNRVISALHTVKFAERGLASYGKPGNYFERQIGRWSKQYLASVTQPIAEMDQLMAWLPAHMPASARDENRVSIVHGDFRLDNLMFHGALAAWTWRRWASRPSRTTSACIANAPDWPPPKSWSPTGTSTWPTTFSVWPPSCKALPSAWRWARHRVPRPRPRAKVPAPWPRWPGLSPSAAEHPQHPCFSRRTHGL